MDEGILTQLAFQLARQQNPEGRLSEKDIERAMAMIKNLIEEGNMPPASMMKDTTTSAFGDAGRGREVPSFLREEAKANGGRIGYQTGGVTESRTLPPEFVEAAQTTAYTSPFQQQVIDATREEFDKQAQIRRNQLAAQTLGVAGAFGGGREGVQRAEFDAASDANRARILADLRQRGFQQAQTARQQDIASQLGIAQLQSGLGGSAQDFARAQIAGLGTLGAQEQAQQQAILDANRQAAAMAVQDPRDRLSTFGQGIAALTPMGAGQVKISPDVATGTTGASPLMTALGVGLAGADIYGRIFKPPGRR